MSEINELVAQLRKSWLYWPQGSPVAEMVKAAADTIERLSAENDDLKERLAEAEARVSGLEYEAQYPRD